MIGTVITIIVYLIIVGILWAVAQYVLSVLPPPAPFDRIVLVVIVVLLGLLLIAALLSVAGFGAYTPVWRY